jgi:hypothetical protein
LSDWLKQFSRTEFAQWLQGTCPGNLKNTLLNGHAGGQHHLKPRAIGMVQIQVLNGLSQEVLSRKPSQQFEYPIKGVLSSRTRKALEEKNQSDQQLANRRLKD